MFQDKYVFAQLISFLNRTQFNNYVRKYDGNRYVKQFACWNQLLAMMFSQLSNRESLRDVKKLCKAYHKLFKWLKQHLYIKKFWGTTENAVRIQIALAIITYCLVAIVHHDMKLEHSTYEVLQILSILLTDKTLLADLFNKTKFNDVKETRLSPFQRTIRLIFNSSFFIGH